MTSPDDDRDDRGAPAPDRAPEASGSLASGMGAPGGGAGPGPFYVEWQLSPAVSPPPAPSEQGRS